MFDYQQLSHYDFINNVAHFRSYAAILGSFRFKISSAAVFYQPRVPSDPQSAFKVFQQCQAKAGSRGDDDEGRERWILA